MKSVDSSDEFANRVAFCVGTGRCGTTFLSEVAALEPEVASSHERERLGATFHMFCKWHSIPVDHEGFLRAKETEILEDLREHRFSFECSALLSHSLEELHERFQSRFVLLIRSPLDTGASFAVRGWFLREIARRDATLPPSYQSEEPARHFLGRNIPHGEEFHRWSKLTQIGKLAWFWNARNRAILDQFQRLPASHCTIVKLEELDFARYRELAKFLGWESQIDEESFQKLAESRLNSGPNAPRTHHEWTSQEIAEFESEAASVAEEVGYDYRIGNIRHIKS